MDKSEELIIELIEILCDYDCTQLFCVRVLLYRQRIKEIIEI